MRNTSQTIKLNFDPSIERFISATVTNHAFPMSGTGKTKNEIRAEIEKSVYEFCDDKISLGHFHHDNRDDIAMLIFENIKIKLGL